MKNILVWTIVLAALTVGCGSQSSTAGGTSSNSTPSSPTGANPSGPAAAAGSYAAVQQIFNQNCMPCHGASNPRAGIDLTSYASVMKGGSRGPIVQAGNVSGSILDSVLRGTNGAPKMPRGRAPLSEADIKAVEAWITAGAKQS